MAFAAKPRMVAPSSISTLFSAVKRCCSNVPDVPRSPSILSDAARGFFEEFVSSLMGKPDLAKAAQLADEISGVLKADPPEVALVKVRGLVAELSKVCNIPTIETRLVQLEGTISADRKIALGVGTLFAAALMGIPASVYIAKVDSDNQISKLETRVEVLESAAVTSDILTKVAIDARVSHELKLDSGEASSPKN